MLYFCRLPGREAHRPDARYAMQSIGLAAARGLGLASLPTQEAWFAACTLDWNCPRTATQRRPRPPPTSRAKWR
jgi:hypothetical protein